MAIMKKLVLFLSVLMSSEVSTVDIKIDPGMRENKPSYIYCDVGAVTSGVTIFTNPTNIKGNCLGPGIDCTSPLYTITQNTSGVLLNISSVDASREEGEWYCIHDTDRSKTIAVNNNTIAGILLRQDWTEPSGTVDTFSANMTLSCTNQVPNFNFTYEDSQSNTGTVPPEAVGTKTNGTTCENGNEFYEITLTASNNLDVFNNKQGVKFYFNYYENSVTAPFSVNFTASSEPTTESPNTTDTSSTTDSSTTQESSTPKSSSESPSSSTSVENTTANITTAYTTTAVPEDESPFACESNCVEETRRIYLSVFLPVLILVAIDVVIIVSVVCNNRGQNKRA